MGTVMKELDDRPIHTQYITGYERNKTKKGFQETLAYLKRYYSMIDAEIYFGNRYVDDVYDIEWQMQQQTQPLFGYNSYTYDEIAQGSRIISGRFSINFSSPNYLGKILEAAKEKTITTMDSYVVPSHDRVTDTVVGVINNALKGTKKNAKRKKIWPTTFDIDVIFGQKTGVGDPVHVVIEGVKLTDYGSAVSASGAGRPDIMEQYSFIAKDITTIG